MSDVQSILLQCVTGLIAGGVIGGAYFSALWWTAQQITASRHPGSLFLTSLLLRMSLLAGGLFAMTRIGTAAVLAAMCGILIARHCLIRVVSTSSTGVNQ